MVPKLLVLGLNPSISLTLVLDGLQLGQVNRAQRGIPSSGGKGQNASVAARTWFDASGMPEAEVHLLQVLGGMTGDAVSQRLRDSYPGIVQHTLAIASPTRTTVTVIDESRGETTELIEPNAGPVGAEEAEKLLQLLAEVIASILSDRGEPSAVEQGPRCGLLLMGTCPPGLAASEIYARAARTFKARLPDGFVLLDTSKGLDAVVEAAEGCIDAVKISLDEAAAFVKARGATDLDGPQVAKLTLDLLVGVDFVGITDGPRSSYLACREAQPDRTVLYAYTPPSLSALFPDVSLLNPIGAGDAVSAVFAASFVGSDGTAEAAREAFANGLSAGSASCLGFETSKFDLVACNSIRKHLTSTDNNEAASSSSM